MSFFLAISLVGYNPEKLERENHRLESAGWDGICSLGPEEGTPGISVFISQPSD